MAELFRTGRTRRLTLTCGYEVGAAYRALQPVGEGYTGGTGLGIAWLGFELWAGSPSHVCGIPPSGAPPNGFLLPVAGGPSGLVWVVQLRLPGDPDTGFGGYFNQYGPWGNPGEQFPVTAYKSLGMPSVPPGERFTVLGSVTLWADVEEWKSIEVDTRTPRAPLDYPTSGKGPVDDDFVGMSTLHYYEGLKSGGQYGFSISIVEGLGAVASGTIPAGMAGPRLYAHTPTVRLFAGPSKDEAFSGAVRRMQVQAADVNYDLLSFQTPHVSFVGDSSGNASAHVGPHVSGPYLATCECAPDTELVVSGVTTKVFQPNYGAPVTYRRSWAEPPAVTKPNGIYQGPVERYEEQNVWVERCEGGNPARLFSRQVPRPDLFLWLDNEWMRLNEEIEQDWRILIADDYSWTPFELSHNVSRTVDACDTTSGWEAENATVTASGGLLRIQVGPGVGRIRKRYDRDSSQYRRLKINARSNPAASMRVTLNDHPTYRWDLTLGTIFKDYLLDLCIPEGSSNLYDLTDSSHVVPGEYYGPKEIRSITLENLAENTLYVISDISLVRTGQASITALPPFDESVLGDDGIRRYRLTWGLCDGRQILDMPYRVDDGTQDRFLSVRQFISMLQSHDACDVRVPSPPGSDERVAYYYNHEKRIAAFMASEWYPAGVRQDLLDVSLLPRVPIRWLQRYDKVGIYPGIGDPAGTYGGPFPLRFTKRLRAICHGLVADAENHKPAIGARVTLRRGQSAWATGQSDQEGYYRVGPFPPGVGQWAIGTEASGPVEIPSGLTDRKYRWVGLAGRVSLFSGRTCVVSDVTGRVFVAFTDAEALKVRRYEPGGEYRDYSVSAGYSSEGFGIAWAAPARLLILLEEGPSSVLLTSYDDGLTWEEISLVFPSGSKPNIVADTATGLIYAFCFSAGAIRCKRSLDGGQTWTPETVVVDQCPEQTFGVAIRPDDKNTLMVSYLDSIGKVRLRISTDNGSSWQER